MDDEELSTMMAQAINEFKAAGDVDSTNIAQGYALRSIAASLIVIAERTINKGRKKKKVK